MGFWKGTSRSVAKNSTTGAETVDEHPFYRSTALAAEKRLTAENADSGKKRKHTIFASELQAIIFSIQKRLLLSMAVLMRILSIAGFFAIALFITTAAAIRGQQPEYGQCGYYPDAHHGKKTASGEIYDKNQLTAAHKSHPFGTLLRVTRLDNKKSIEVRVNDRGPFVGGYVVDISRKAAEAIGLTRDGVAKVKVEVIGTAGAAGSKAIKAAEVSASSTSASVASAGEAASKLVIPGRSSPSAAPRTLAPATYSTSSIVKPQTSAAPTLRQSVSEVYQIEIKTVPSKSFGLQLSVLSSTENLFREIKKVQGIWPQKVIIGHEKTGNTTTYKILVGPFSSRKEAEAQQKVAKQKGYPKTFIVEFM